ncbi:MAG: ATP synthase F1 subunit gamma [Gemmatimonadota bacterium]
MATLKDLRTRIGSIGSIRRVTRAMQLVAAAHLRRAQEAIEAARPYAVHLERVLEQLRESELGGQHPMLADRPVRRAQVVVLTSDRGLCGGFNSAICRCATAEMARLGQGPTARVEIDLVAIGRVGRDHFQKRGCQLVEEHVGAFRASPTFGEAAAVAQAATARFLAGQVDRVLLVYSEFRSVAQQVATAHQLLPVPPMPAGEGGGHLHNSIFEPEPAALLADLMPRFVRYAVWRAFLESYAAEQAARLAAMDNATRNAGDFIEELTRELNKVRQASITLELMDIVGGAQAVA